MSQVEKAETVVAEFASAARKSRRAWPFVGPATAPNGRRSQKTTLRASSARKETRPRDVVDPDSRNPPRRLRALLASVQRRARMSDVCGGRRTEGRDHRP